MKKIYIHIIHIVLFAALTFFYCSPIKDGKVVKSHDIEQFKGGSQEIEKFRKDTGEEALWTNSMFSGMPTFQMGVKYLNNILIPIDKIFQLGFPRPIGSIFICFLGFYILLLTLKIDLKIAFLGALAFGLSTYLYIIIEAGHNTKIHAIAYMAPTIAAMIYCYRDKRLLGFFLTFLFLGLQIRANHLQITYYLLFLLFGFWLYEIICSARKKELKKFLKNTVVFSLGCFFAILINIASLWSTYDYSKYSIRGGSEINLEDKKTNQDGLDFGDVTAWSYGKSETFNLMIPNLYGGSTYSSELSEESNYYKELVNLKNDGSLDIVSDLQGIEKSKYIDQKMESVRMYWGEQPMTQGPVYIGSIVVFLFFLALFIMNDRGIKVFKKSFILGWILFAVIILSILLSWGSNFWLTDYFYKYFPLYSKFRSITMILVIVEIAIPILAVIGLTKFLDIDFSPKNQKRKRIYLITSFSIFSIICAFLFFSFKGKDFMGPRDKIESKIDIYKSEKQIDYLEQAIPYAYNMSDNELYQLKKEDQDQVLDLRNNGVEYLFNTANNIIDKRLLEPSQYDRELLFFKDLRRSLVFVFLAVIILSLFLMKRINRNIVIYLIAGLIIMDMWFVNKRYFNSDHFIEKEKFEEPFKEEQYDKDIKKDRSKHYRVLDLTNKQEKVSYFHKNMLGKHAAGLSRYDDIVEQFFRKEFKDNNEQLSSSLARNKVINMLNVKWINGEENQFSLGNSWFIDSVKYVSSPQEEFNYLLDSDFEPHSIAIVNKKDKLHISRSNYETNQKDTIYLTKYSPNELEYKSKAETSRLAVFSEVYYPKGWNAYIDGKKVDHFCANYILRALEVPAGEHTITFRFEPNSFYVGNNIALASSIVFILTFISLFFPYFRRKFSLLKK